MAKTMCIFTTVLLFVLGSLDGSSWGARNLAKEGGRISLSSLSTGWVCADTAGPLRADLDCAYDIARNRLVIFGGVDSLDQVSAETWEWDGTDWINMAAEGPGPRANFALVYDAARAEVLLFGGWTLGDSYLDDTWVWNGFAWTQKEASGPCARANCAVAYDGNRGKVVLFGGSWYQSIFGDTWEWDGTQWELVSAEGPDPRIFSRMTYDISRQKCVLFGGQTHYLGTTLQDTWEWDGSGWTLVDTDGPPARCWHMMTYDKVRDRVVLFGGQDKFYGENWFDDTWEWNGNDWTQISVQGPPARRGGSMVFHDTLGHLVLFGGLNADKHFGDLWVFPEEITAVDDRDIPLVGMSLGNFPNPFNPGTLIDYGVPERGPVSIEIFDVSGRSICHLVDEEQSAGPHKVTWTGRNDTGAAVGSGVYFCRLQSGKQTLTKRMVLLK